MGDAVTNKTLEQLVLGGILLNEENYWNISDVLTLDMFGLEDHQKIYAVVSELASDNRAIRVPIVAGRIGTLSEGKDAEAYMSGLLHMAGKEEHLPLEDYAYELRDSMTRRKVISLAEGMLKSANDSNIDPDQVVERASERIADISRQSKIESESTLSATIKKMLKTSSDPKKRDAALQPCLLGIAQMVGGGKFQPSNLILWGGAPASGKTLIAMQQALFTSEVAPTTLVELEMDDASLVARSIVRHTGVPLRDVLRGVSEEQYGKLQEAEQLFQNYKLRILSPSKMTIGQIRDRAYAHRRKYGVDLLIVDHLKLIERPSKTRMDPVERAYENARDLKALAKDLNCVVIALCQFTKMARQKEVPEPEMEDFYGGSLEEHADVMLANFNRHDWLVKNPPKTSAGKIMDEWNVKVDKAKGKIEVYKLKDRFGVPRDRRIFAWDGKRSVFNDIEEHQEALTFDNYSRGE